MDTRLGVIEKSHKILKRRFKKMKVEKRLTSLEEYQRRLIRGAKKQKAIEERLDGIEKDMKRKENENENNEELRQQPRIWGEGLGQFLLSGMMRSFAKETNEPATDKGAEGAENDPKPRVDRESLLTQRSSQRQNRGHALPITVDFLSLHRADTNEIEGLRRRSQELRLSELFCV
ncbi:hypothetical protein Bca52824_002836 [Brassica carinata]|uniref:Uncharacterized protein n=1 Tax=Brassica carinata TaxID=52824 RepID=A0A8X7WLG6_BRACI|nr:hypothetical protein Bca52824_002836 [Brassica carinata]